MTRGNKHQSTLTSTTIASPIGPLVVVEDETDALFMVEFADCDDRMERWLHHRLASGRFALRAGTISRATREAFAAYFDGSVGALRQLPIRLDGTPFQNTMWTALRDIAPGETLAYGLFAQRLGRPRAARAVGHANGSNPMSVVVPCHRLVGSDGALTNYGGGLQRKRWLIDHEARHAVQDRFEPERLRG